MRGPLNPCLAPCAGGCTRQEYARHIEAARALLDGSDASIIDRLETACRCLESLKMASGRERESWDEDFDQMQLVASWFRQYPEELTSVLQPEQAGEYCRTLI
jgi:excinuclease ABC subunit C